MDMNQAFGELAHSNQTLAFILVVAANVVLGVLAALKDRQFELAEVANIFNKLWPMLGAYFALNVGGEAMGGPTGNAVQVVSWATMLPFLKGAVKNLREVGVPVEKVTGKAVADLVGKPDKTPMQVAFENWESELNTILRDYRASTISDVVAQAKATLIYEKYKEHGVPSTPPGWPATS